MFFCHHEAVPGSRHHPEEARVPRDQGAVQHSGGCDHRDFLSNQGHDRKGGLLPSCRHPSAVHHYGPRDAAGHREVHEAGHSGPEPRRVFCCPRLLPPPLQDKWRVGSSEKVT